MYGFSVGDKVNHIKDVNGDIAYVIEIDSDYDLGGITTCRLVWNVSSFEEAKSAKKEDQDIQWTNKLVLAE